VDVSPRPPFPPGLFPVENSSFEKARIDTLSIFGQDRWDLRDDLQLFLGLRYNHIETEIEEVRSTQAASEPGSSTDDQVSSSLALTYSGIANTLLRALYSSGYINPTLLQSYGRTTAGGQTVFGNPDLDLETADNFELGYRYDGAALVLDAVAFYTKSSDYIACSMPYPGSGAAWTSRSPRGSDGRAGSFAIAAIKAARYATPTSSGCWLAPLRRAWVRDAYPRHSPEAPRGYLYPTRS